MILVKPGVRFKAFTPALMRILNVLARLAEVYPDLPTDGLVITSANDSAHMKGSRHYTNEAIDVRSKSFVTLTSKRAFATAMRQHLGPRFTVLLERAGMDNEHFHIQPKKGTTYG